MSPQLPARILPRACVCGHTHRTPKGTPVYLCFDCPCDRETPRCQACGKPALRTRPNPVDACSRECSEHLDHLIDHLSTEAA